jgi:hypothetical protein
MEIGFFDELSAAAATLHGEIWFVTQKKTLMQPQIGLLNLLW